MEHESGGVGRRKQCFVVRRDEGESEGLLGQQQEEEGGQHEQQEQEEPVTQEQKERCSLLQSL